MATIEKKSFDSPDNVMRPAEKVKVDFVTVGGLMFGRVTMQPGWRWAKDIKPIVKTEICPKYGRKKAQ
ncbi:MAG: hypothetical protein V1850_05445 [Candidatus Bathyarchaeota archaeon]